VSVAVAIQPEHQTRASLYSLLGMPFRFPEERLVKRFITGEWQKELSVTLRGLGISFPELDDLRLGLSAKQYEVEFIALYEVGMGGAPCPLHSGHYARDRMRIMEEVLRFYRFFNYKPDRSADRFPDHINFELEFMGHLAQLQDEAIPDSEDAQSLLLAQKDFITRNLVSWLPDLSQRIEERSEVEFFKAVGRCANQVVQLDSVMLQQQTEKLELAEEGEHPNE
jgi:DMSO reductase family type II enzyme chaperone